MPSTNRKTALVSPLNWGLGHAARCVPIIQELFDSGVEVHIASDGEALQFLSKEFPHLTVHKLHPLHITYGRYLKWHLFKQSFGFFQAMKMDQLLTRKLCELIDFDYIISDNRYGVFHPASHNVLITHQLQILKPGILKSISGWIFRKLASNFDQCWIPDIHGDNSLTGALSSPEIGIPKHYVGVFSRLTPRERLHMGHEIAIVLSGPEPHRSHFEHKLIVELKNLETLPKTILIRGLPEEGQLLTWSHPNLTIQNFADSDSLENILNNARRIICRSGYTSIMDLITLNKQAILIPTPGQPEQEYLAQRLNRHALFTSFSENSFNLKEAIKSEYSHVQCDEVNYSADSITELLPGLL